MSLLGAPATPVHPRGRENLHSQGHREKLAKPADILFCCVSIFLAGNKDREEGEKCEGR